MELDLSPLLTVLVEVLAGALLTVGTWAAKRLADKLKMDEDSQARTYLQDAIVRGIEYGAEQSKKYGNKNFSDFKVRNGVTYEAVSYLLDHVPDVMKRFGIDEDRAASMIEARLESWLPKEGK